MAWPLALAFASVILAAVAWYRRFTRALDAALKLP